MYPESVIRYISGNYCEEDNEFVKEWISEDPTRKEEIEELQKLWDKTNHLKIQGNVNKSWTQFSEQIEKGSSTSKKIQIAELPGKKSNSRLISLVIWAAAAACIIVGTFAFYKYNYMPPEQTQQQLIFQSLISEEGEQVHYRFNDGTKVVLNSSSKIRYRSDYGKGTRQLELEGEAYFEVNHDHQLPFIVKTRDLTVRDIGTKFNINAYPDNEISEVVTSEGSVEVTDARDQKSQASSQGIRNAVLIRQGEKARIDLYTRELVVGKADLHASLGWLNKRLIFDEEVFGSVVNRLERFYNIKVIVKDDILLKKQITASFEDESMENVSKVLSLSLGAKYKINDRTVEFYNEP